LWATILYVLVTVATMNVALVVAAIVMGVVFTAEREATRGVLAPLVTHVTWSTLVLFLLPLTRGCRTGSSRGVHHDHGGVHDDHAFLSIPAGDAQGSPP